MVASHLPLQPHRTDPLFRFATGGPVRAGMGARLGFARVARARDAGDEDQDELCLTTIRRARRSGCGPAPLPARVAGPLLRVRLVELELKPERCCGVALAQLIEAAEETTAAAALLALLEDPAEPFTAARRQLLRELTAQDFGQDRQGWLAWWHDNRQRCRFEWLLDGLLHKNPDLRLHAAAELRQITGETFGYDPRHPRRRREAARREYLEWWSCKRWQAELL